MSFFFFGIYIFLIVKRGIPFSSHSMEPIKETEHRARFPIIGFEQCITRFLSHNNKRGARTNWRHYNNVVDAGQKVWFEDLTVGRWFDIGSVNNSLRKTPVLARHWEFVCSATHLFKTTCGRRCDVPCDYMRTISKISWIKSWISDI